MLGLVTHLVSFARRARVTTFVVAIPVVFCAAPARAQDFFGLFRLFSPPVARVPVYSPYDHRTVPHFERRIVPRRPKAARLDKPPSKMPLKPKPLGEVANPVPELLADSTLRPGDLVMFPDGPRVFVGRPGKQHVLADFEPVSPASKAIPPSTRKLIANLRPGWNGAWSAEKTRAGGRLAAKTTDVDAVGSVTPAHR